MPQPSQSPNNPDPPSDAPPFQPDAVKSETIDPASIPEDSERQLEKGIAVVKSPSGLGILIDGYGFRLSRKSERLVVKKADGKAVWQFPLENLSDIFLFRNGSSITTDLIGAAGERGVAIHVMDRNGKPVSQLQSANLTATIEARRAQLRAEGTQKGRYLAASFASGKVLNQSRLLRYFGKYLRQSNPEKAEKILVTALEILRIRRQIKELSKSDDPEFRQTLMGLEGNAANRYWEAVALIIQDKLEFQGREHQGACDPVNCMLNYGYGILYAQVWSAVLRAGLEPFAGFLHTDRPGKPSLVLDLTEEFRAPVVDRTVIAAINLGQISEVKNGRMTLDSRVELSDKIFKRLESREMVRAKSYQIRSIVQMQARQVASYLCGRIETYRPFRFKW